MGLADLVAPEAAADGHDAQLGKDDGAPEGGKKDSEIVFRCERSGFLSYAKKFKDGTTVNDNDSLYICSKMCLLKNGLFSK